MPLTSCAKLVIEAETVQALKSFGSSILKVAQVNWDSPSNAFVLMTSLANEIISSALAS